MFEPNLFGDVDADHQLQGATGGDPLFASWHRPLVVAWGMGVNSTAMLIGMAERGIRPDLILTADTGGEKPETYAFVRTFRLWLADVDFPELIVVRRKPYPPDSNAVGATTLEEYCLATGALPSIAYGHPSCSDQWKRRPQEALVAQWPDAVACWERGEKVCKAIGYDAGESERAQRQAAKDNPRYHFWYPLIGWGWGREECVRTIEAAGLPVPPKSACFYCPSSTKAEVLALHRDHPCLFARAVAMEHTAAGYNQNVKGLGRRFSWEGLVSLPLLEQAGLADPPAAPCMCQDDPD